MRPAWTAEVTAPGFLRGLDQLALGRRRPGSSGPGEGRGTSPRSCGLDWVGHRPYQSGDDLRYLDWHVLARIGKTYVRQFLPERADRLDLLVDRSRSMSLGSPPKSEIASALAFALGYVGLSSGARVGVTCFADRILAGLPAVRGPAHRARLLDFLTLVPDGEGTAAAKCLRSFAAQAVEIGQVIVISDLLAEDFEGGLGSLRRRGFEVSVLRLRAPSDEDPDLPEDGATVIDVETGAERLVVLEPGDREHYRLLRRRELDRVVRFCARSRIRLANLEARREIREMMFGELRDAGVVA